MLNLQKILPKAKLNPVLLSALPVLRRLQILIPLQRDNLPIVLRTPLLTRALPNVPQPAGGLRVLVIQKTHVKVSVSRIINTLTFGWRLNDLVKLIIS